MYKYVQYRNQLSPHIFWIADQAYRKLCLSKAAQCIAVSGESGAGRIERFLFRRKCHRIRFIGKTESTKLMVSHIIHCSGDAGDRELQNRIIEVRHLFESISSISFSQC